MDQVYYWATMWDVLIQLSSVTVFQIFSRSSHFFHIKALRAESDFNGRGTLALAEISNLSPSLHACPWVQPRCNWVEAFHGGQIIQTPAGYPNITSTVCKHHGHPTCLDPKIPIQITQYFPLTMDVS